MGKISILTREQKIILDKVKQTDFFRSHFYFTGGTALSEYYLQHRYSEDLDFFSNKKLDNQAILHYMDSWSRELGFTFQSRFPEVVYIFTLTFPDNTLLKVDFAHYPYERVESGQLIDNFTVDSLMDIGINKLVTISQRTDIKDFVDLFFLLQSLSLWDLIQGVRIKFRMKLEPELLAADFLKIEDFPALPNMIHPLTLDELKKFYRERAKALGMQAVE